MAPRCYYFLSARLKFIKVEYAAPASLLSGATDRSGEIVGTLDHLYFAGTPTVASIWIRDAFVWFALQLVLTKGESRAINLS